MHHSLNNIVLLLNPHKESFKESSDSLPVTALGDHEDDGVDDDPSPVEHVCNGMNCRVLEAFVKVVNSPRWEKCQHKEKENHEEHQYEDIFCLPVFGDCSRVCNHFDLDKDDDVTDDHDGAGDKNEYVVDECLGASAIYIRSNRTALSVGFLVHLATQTKNRRKQESKWQDPTQEDNQIPHSAVEYLLCSFLEK